MKLERLPRTLAELDVVVASTKSRKQRRDLARIARKIRKHKPDTCPACGSQLVFVATQLDTAILDCCATCSATWERDDRREGATSDPCGNCAFRPGSAEQADPARWREIVDGTVRKTGFFFCHKRVPVHIDKNGVLEFQFKKNNKGVPINASLCVGWGEARISRCDRSAAGADGA